MKFAGERYHFPENIRTTKVSDTILETHYSIRSKVVDTMDQEILDSIFEAARNDGITELIVFDKQFILDAIREKLDRMKEV